MTNEVIIVLQVKNVPLNQRSQTTASQANITQILDWVWCLVVLANFAFSCMVASKGGI
jgi:hypothetical protein